MMAVWIGFVDVTLTDGPDEDGMVGACMWAACIAESADDFERLVRAELAMHDATPREFSDVEPLASRKEREQLSRSLNRLDHHAQQSGIALGTWHLYPDDE
jgi:hypothetical protein